MPPANRLRSLSKSSQRAIAPPVKWTGSRLHNVRHKLRAVLESPPTCHDGGMEEHRAYLTQRFGSKQASEARETASRVELRPELLHFSETLVYARERVRRRAEGRGEGH